MNLNEYEKINTDILFGIVNMKLRDEFESIDELCAYFDIDKTKLTNKLLMSGYIFHAEINQFRRV